MTLFTITDDCTGCGLCARACPASLVRQKAKGERPEPLAGREAHCILCGHCVAVCKTGAFVHGLLPAADFEAISRERLPEFGAFRHLLQSRRSCRVYADKPLSRDAIGELLDVVRYAPTGHNTRSVGYVVVERMDAAREAVVDWMRQEVAAGTERADVLHLAGAIKAVEKGKDVVFRGAPQAVVVHAPAEEVSPETDAIVAGAWLELTAAARGYGACWCGYLMFALAGYPPVGALLGIPEGHKGYAALLLGRPAVRPVSIPPREMPEVRFF